MYRERESKRERERERERGREGGREGEKERDRKRAFLSTVTCNKINRQQQASKTNALHI